MTEPSYAAFGITITHTQRPTGDWVCIVKHDGKAIWHVVGQNLDFALSAGEYLGTEYADELRATGLVGELDDAT